MKISLNHPVYIFVLLLFAPLITNAQQPELIVQTGLTNGVVTVAFSPDGKAIITSTQGGASTTASVSVQLWDAKNGGLIRTINAEEIGTADSLAISPDGQMFAAVARNQRGKN